MSQTRSLHTKLLKSRFTHPAPLAGVMTLFKSADITNVSEWGHDLLRRNGRENCAKCSPLSNIQKSFHYSYNLGYVVFRLISMNVNCNDLSHIPFNLFCTTRKIACQSGGGRGLFGCSAPPGKLACGRTGKEPALWWSQASCSTGTSSCK